MSKQLKKYPIIYKDEETIRRHNNFLEYQKQRNKSQNNDTENNTVLETETNVSSHKPEYIYNEKTGEFNYKNPEFQQKAWQRQKRKLENKDYLEYKLKRIRKKLSYAGLEEDIGKTGDSRTGEVSEKHKRVASSQIEDYKDTSSNTHKKLQELTPSIKEGMEQTSLDFTA